MMRFLAVYSTTPFQVDCTISEYSSKLSEKKSKKLFSFFPLRITKKLQKNRWDALSNTFHRFVQNEGRDTFF